MGRSQHEYSPKGKSFEGVNARDGSARSSYRGARTAAGNWDKASPIPSTGRVPRDLDKEDKQRPWRTADPLARRYSKPNSSKKGSDSVVGNLSYVSSNSTGRTYSGRPGTIYVEKEKPDPYKRYGGYVPKSDSLVTSKSEHNKCRSLVSVSRPRSRLAVSISSSEDEDDEDVQKVSWFSKFMHKMKSIGRSKRPCIVCYEEEIAKKLESLQCGHVFCDKCREVALRAAPECPVCARADDAAASAAPAPKPSCLKARA